MWVSKRNFVTHLLFILINQASIYLTSIFLKDPINSKFHCRYLLPHHPRGKQKTAVCRKTTSPRWDATLSWEELSIEDLADRSLELAVWDHDRLGHQDLIGGVRLNLGSGTNYSNITIDTL